MSDYTKDAPLLSKGVPESKFKQDHPKRIKSAVPVDVEPSAEKVAEIYELLRTVEKDMWGAVGIARKTGVDVQWVKQLHAEVKALKAADLNEEPE